MYYTQSIASLVFLAMCFGSGACDSASKPSGGSKSQIVKTSKGTFTLPSPALADGRELEGQSVRVWNTPSRTKMNCLVPDGEPLVLTSAIHNKNEDRYYFELTAMNGCKGWLSEPFVRPDPDARSK